MKYIAARDNSELPTLELSRRNLETLLAKLDDPYSARTLIDSDAEIAVVAVENDAHYKTRLPGPTRTNGVYDDGRFLS